MHRERIQAALSKALTHLEEAMNAVTTSKSDEKALADSLWAASAETEYAVFLLALVQGDRAEKASWKRGSAAKQSIELEAALSSSRGLLKSAEARVEGEDFEKSYEIARSARNLLLKAQELLEKKRKEGRK